MINSKNKKFVIQLVVQVWEEYVCVSGRSVAVAHPMYCQRGTVRCRYTGCRYCVISSWAMDLLFVVTYPIPTNKTLIIHSIYEKIAKLGRISSFEVHLLSTRGNNEIWWEEKTTPSSFLEVFLLFLHDTLSEYMWIWEYCHGCLFLMPRLHNSWNQDQKS